MRSKATPCWCPPYTDIAISTSTCRLPPHSGEDTEDLFSFLYHRSSPGLVDAAMRV